MAIYYFDVSNVSRNSGKKSSSSVASSAYQNRACYTDERTGEVYDYTKKGGLYHSEILSPDNAPESLTTSPDALWNSVEATEKRKDARLAKSFKISLPLELTPEQNKALILDFTKRAFVEKGMIADVAIHDIDTQPHSHIKTTTRELTPDGFGKKVRAWDDKETMMEWRKTWADVANEHLLKAGIKDVSISHLTLKEQMREAIEAMEKATSLEEKIKFASKAIELDRPAMKNINIKDWRNPEFQKIRKQEQEAKKEIIKKSQSFKLENKRTLDDIQNEISKKFKPTKIYESIKQTFIKIDKITSESKLNIFLNDATDTIKDKIKSGLNSAKSFNVKKSIKKWKRERERKKYPNLYKSQDYHDSEKYKKDMQERNNKIDEERERKIKMEDERKAQADYEKLSSNQNRRQNKEQNNNPDAGIKSKSQFKPKM
ncbi:MobQ family relaxase [Salmonella enterica]